MEAHEAEALRVLPNNNEGTVTPERFKEKLETLLKDLQQLLGDKNDEYARSTDKLANFKRRADITGLNPLDVWLIDVQKHQDAIVSFVQSFRAGKELRVNDPIARRSLDDIAYQFLFLCLLEDLSVKEELTATGAKEHTYPVGIGGLNTAIAKNLR